MVGTNTLASYILLTFSSRENCNQSEIHNPIEATQGHNQGIAGE
jgi:hypothetical protein